MTHLAHIIILLVSFNSSLYAQYDNNNLEWQEGRKVEWSDFQARPDISSQYAANTYSTVTYEYNWNDEGKITMYLKCVFVRENSWKKNEKRLTPHLLEHEQKHFDISEIFTRKMRKAYAEYTATHKYSANAEKEISAIFKKYMAECHKYQEQYDIETEHSVAKAKQLEWNQKINAELAAWAKYKGN